MGIETYGYMVFSSMKQILNDVHDADVSVVTIRCSWSNMVSQRLKKHASDLVYLQKTKPCIRKHLITKADRSLSFSRSRCSFRLTDVSPAVLVTNQILWNICFS
jgi:hypothetical protein